MLGAKLGILDKQYNIVTDGLVLYYQPGFVKCYPGTGTSAYNLASGSLTPTGSMLDHTNVVGPSGNAGGYFVLDGTNDSIKIVNESSLQITGDITLSGWVYLDSYATNNDHIIAKESSYILKANQNSTSRPRFQLHDGSFKTLQGTSQLSLSTWHNVVGVKGDDVMRLYINGVDIGSTTAYTGTTTSNSNNVYISGYNGSGTYVSDGNMTEIKIYNIALSAGEVLQNYNATKDRYT
jgi:hypothetical protein